MKVPFPREQQPEHVPGAAYVNSQQDQAGKIGQKTGKQGGSHDRVQAVALEQPSGNAHGKGAGSKAGQHHCIDGFPDAPGIGIVHAGNRSQPC